MVILSKLLLSSLVALQVLGPSWVLAIQTSQGFVQGASKSQALIAGVRGGVTVTPGMENSPGYAPKYRTVLAIGDVISTEEESVAEILLENQRLVTIQEYSEAMLEKNANGGLSVALEIGAAEWSIPIQRQDDIALTFTTPNIRATTHGGLVTAEVQPTLGELALAPRLRNSFLIRTSLRAKSTSAGNGGLSETFCVNEGDLTVEYPGAQQGLWEQETVAAGECVGFLNGQLRAMVTQERLVDWRAVCAVGTHCQIPESARKLIAKKQMGQALALERVLVGSDVEDPKVDEQIILATTGLSLAGDIQGSGPGGVDTGGVILPTTGDNSSGGGAPGPGPGNPLPPPEFPDPNVGEMGLPLTPFFKIGSAGGGGEPPPLPVPGNIQTGGTLWPVNGMPGGQGLLTFIMGDFTADKELLLTDSGLLASAPHVGKAPGFSLVVSGLSPIGAVSPSNQKLPLEFGAFAFTFPDFKPVKTSNAQLGTENFNDGVPGGARFAQLSQLAQFGRSPSIDADHILFALPESDAEFPCPASLGSCFEVVLAAGLGGLETPDQKPESGAGVDAVIQARSASTTDPTPGDNRLVTLKKGVVLGNTQVSLALQDKTNDSFSGLETTLGQAIQGAAVSILGEPGNPALVNVEDRILAILEGSHIQPANPIETTALVAILDGTLRGPVEPSVIGRDAANIDILRKDVSPIIEMIGGSAEVTTGVMVGSTAGIGQTGDLDQALLEASSPLLAMMQSSMTTSTDFGRVAGQNAKLVATLIPGDALVRLNASSLMVNGNLFNVTGGGQLNVDGSLLSVQGGSTVTLNGGVFVNVGAGSSFSLTGALVDFGAGTNVVNVSNDLCAGGGCFAPFANPAYQVSGNSADFSATAGVNPFVDLGTFSDGSVNTLNVGQDSAILAVEPGGSIQIQ